MKYILFLLKRKLRKADKPNINYQGIDNKQNSQVTHVSCMLNKTMFHPKFRVEFDELNHNVQK